jgi:hypothetical protein
MAAMTNLAPGGGEGGVGQTTAIRNVRVWTRNGMVVVRTLLPTNFRGSTGF